MARSHANSNPEFQTFAVFCMLYVFFMAQAIFEPNLLSLATQTILKFSNSSPTTLWRWNRQSVPKRRHIKFRRRGITQKKTYSNPEIVLFYCWSYAHYLD